MAEGLFVFPDIVQPELIFYASDMAEFGVILHGPELRLRLRKEVYATATDNPERTASELCEDLAKGRLFLFTVASVDYTGNQIDPNLTFVCQQDVTNPDVIKTRLITDPRLEVNTLCYNENNPACVSLNIRMWLAGCSTGKEGIARRLC